jgi:hypothetical protein
MINTITSSKKVRPIKPNQAKSSLRNFFGRDLAIYDFAFAELQTFNLQPGTGSSALRQSVV